MKLTTAVVYKMTLAGVILLPGISPAWSPAERTKHAAPRDARGDCGCSRESFHPEHLLVRFKPSLPRADRRDVHNAARIKRVLRDYHVVSGLQLVEVEKDRLPDALAAYRSHPDVLYAEPDYIVYPAVVPDDPDFAQLWGMHNTGQTVDGDPGTAGADLRAPQAWDFWTGDPDFTIAVIDTGIDYEHPDLEANVWTNPDEVPDNEIDDDGNGYVDDVHGYNFKYDFGDPMDIGSHGTHVAGTIGAVANNNEGVVGINWGCKLIALRFMDGSW